MYIYRTRTIISHRLYIFYPISKDHFLGEPQGTPRTPEEPTPSNAKVTKENGVILCP